MTRSLIILAILLTAFSLMASEPASITNLTGEWHGKSRFTGISYNEATQKKVAPQEVEITLQISADGKVTGRVGGAELSDCVATLNRGWFGRMLNIETDFIIRGKMIGAVAAGSENQTNTINAPFNLADGRIKGTLFIVHPFTYPYPILGLHLNREP